MISCLWAAGPRALRALWPAAVEPTGTKLLRQPIIALGIEGISVGIPSARVVNLQVSPWARVVNPQLFRNYGVITP